MFCLLRGCVSRFGDWIHRLDWRPRRLARSSRINPTHTGSTVAVECSAHPIVNRLVEASTLQTGWERGLAWQASVCTMARLWLCTMTLGRYPRESICAFAWPPQALVCTACIKQPPERGGSQVARESTNPACPAEATAKTKTPDLGGLIDTSMNVLSLFVCCTSHPVWFHDRRGMASSLGLRFLGRVRRPCLKPPLAMA